MNYSDTIQAFLDKSQADPSYQNSPLLAEACGLLRDLQRGLENREIDPALPSAQLPKKNEVEKTCRGIGHDFNGILANIRGLVEITQMMAPDTSEKVQESFSRIINIVERGHHSTELVRLYGKVHSYDKRRLPLLQCLRRSLNDIKMEMGLDTAIDFYCPDHKYICFDEMQFEAMLKQLVKNAIKAISETDKEPQLQVQVTAKDETWLEVSVSDNGEGIAPEVGDKVYFPFYSTRRANEGLGLGLSIVKQIVMNHDGQISYQSRHHEGSRFTCLLPVLCE